MTTTHDNNIILAAISRYSNVAIFYYDNAFGEAGLDIHYLKERKQVLLGAPGVKGWNGYKITSARFEVTGTNIWYIAGVPRADALLGNVKIFNNDGKLVVTLTGSEMGSYFGSTVLAVDLNNDHIDDLLIGAPMGAGTTWDEGYVYFYNYHQSKLANPVILVGAKKMGARFGTAIVSLGDIDLDSYNDIAISAPHEDDGVGAVYIYMGSISGINSIYSQRLSPQEFPLNFGSVKGFGQGLSRGVDIDGNGHNDLAVGAYKSNQVFIIKTISVIDYKLSLESNVTSISTNFINVKFCILYTQRSKTQELKIINFKSDLLLDYRVEGETNITHISQVALSKDYCKSFDIILKILFKFDIKAMNPDIDKVAINFEVKCLGESLSPDAAKTELILDVLLKNSPYIQGSSVPDNFYFNNENIMNDIEISHIFKIGNSGPSPVKLDVYLLLPIGSFSGIQVQCYPTNETFENENKNDVQSLLTESPNRTVVIDCFEEGNECLILYCDGEYLYKSTEIAEYNIKIKTNINLLGSRCHFFDRNYREKLKEEKLMDKKIEDDPDNSEQSNPEPDI
ncbi:hypothetical protein NQ314_011344 [Rhamnusium bicolor]|uniref:Uncharacterized protein n=1 Tax=Rhamnusium bicolor TaxID=1586634 RepID=A0AAV8XIC5_9CUCU|nr:hypothetical protein NQ314_011344 [Rhamnusium bicolor]